MPRTTRSCKDLSITEIQSKIDFPQRKTRQSISNKKNIPTTTKPKALTKTTTTRSTRKRVAVTNDENAVSPIKSPRKNVLSPFKSPLVDRSNFLPAETAAIVKRKLDLSSGNPKNDESYTKIRQALHTSIPMELISREKELGQIKGFIEMSVIGCHPGSLYMSGAPGTGKTACLTKILEEYKCTTNKKLKSIFLNCMSLKYSQNIFSKVAEEINDAAKTCSSKDALKYLEKKFTSSGPKILLVLDEIDQLESKNQEILYKLFEMPFLPKSRLVLVGIANALDLTDRVLPRLQARSSCKPMLLQFPPYSKDEITLILQERIREISSDVVDPSAIQFCARKVSAMSGDVRKALDILRRSVEIVESDTRKRDRPCLKTISKPSDIKSSKKITIAHVASVCSEVYGSRMSTSGNITFPLQQKIVVCTLMLCLKDKKIKEITNAKLYESYCRVCRSRQLNYVNQEEFGGICTLLESQGVVAVKETKDVRNNKISLRLQESEVEHALQDKTLLSAILANGIPS